VAGTAPHPVLCYSLSASQYLLAYRHPRSYCIATQSRNLTAQLTNIKFPILNHPEEKMPEEETVTIRFTVYCGNLTPDGVQREFSFLEQAPASLCVHHSDDGPQPDPDAIGPFLTKLVDAHYSEILRSRAWQCNVCNKPATEILHHAIPLLSPNRERAMPSFVPSVIVIAAPICISAGACDRKALQAIHAYERLAGLWDTSSTCDKCGKKSGVRRCGGCKLLA
jgi:hypothetical protein